MQKLVLILYVDAIQRHWIHVAMRVIATHEELLLQSERVVLAPLLQSMIDSPFQMDNKLAMIKLFLPKIQFQYVDILVTNLQKLVLDSAT